MSDKSTKKEQFSPETLKVAETLKPLLKLADGKPEAIPASFYSSTLPEGLSLEIVEQVRAHDQHVFAGAAKAFVDFSSAEMAKDKSLTSLEISIPMVGRDHYDLNVDRRREFTVGDKPPVVQHCVLDAAYVVHGARTKVGELSKVKAYGRELGESLLATLAD